ncbi:MAG TPA: tetratricopeptide repeat protein [Vicinamibacterales bacterium]|nr:tetratricopeptide repeat protein [Vicinamibacterales bacterium]
MDATRRRFSWALGGVMLLALVVRLAYLSQLGGSPLLSILMGDARQYDEWARRIAGGDWLGTGVFYQAPLYPYFLGSLYTVTGPDPGAVRTVQCALGALACGMLGLAGRTLFGSAAGLAAALLLALYPPAIFFDGLIQKSSLDTLLVASILLLVAALQGGPGWKRLAGLGAAVSLLALNRENARAIHPVIAAWLLLGFRHASRTRRAAWVGVFAAASLAVLLPVGLRNYCVGGAFLVSSSQFGPNFYIGNHAGASGSYEPLVPGRGDAAYERADATRLASEAAGRPLAPSAVSDYWAGKALSFIREQPGQWLALVARKAALAINAAEIPDTESIEAYASASWLLRGLLWLNFGVVLPLGAFGCWASRADWRRLSVLYALLATLLLSVVAFYVVARYRHPVAPLVLIFAGAGLAAAPEALASGRCAAHSRERTARGRTEATGRVFLRPPAWARRWGPGVAMAALTAAASNVPMKVTHDETWINLGSLLVQSHRAAEALPVLEKAAAADPSYAVPHYQLGLAHRQLGQPRQALDALSAAIRLKPDYAEAYSALGATLRALGRQDAAVASFRASARHAPESAEAHTNLGLSLMESGQIEEAVSEHRRAVALAPAAPAPRNNLALALQHAGRLQEAIAEYRAALLLKPDYAEAHANLGMALAAAGDAVGARGHVREALRLARASNQAELAERIEEALRQLEAPSR